MYSEKILDIFKNPQNAGGLQGSNGIGKYVDENCGDYVKIYLKIDENEKIIDARFKTMGSVCSIVASSVLVTEIVGMTISKAENLTSDIITNKTGVFPAGKEESIEFALSSLRLAIEDFRISREKAEKTGKKPVYATTKVKEEPKKVEIKKEFVEETKEVEVKTEPVEEIEKQVVIEEPVKEIKENKTVKEENGEKTISNAKKAFDALFEAWND